MKTTAVLVATATVALAALAPTATHAATTTCNGACPENLKPLCGSDGITYDNECMFEFAKCTAANAGKTPALTIVSDGRCGVTTTPTPTPSSACAKEFACLQVIDPVCGSDGKTYNSACELKQVQCASKPTLTVKSKGECPSGGGSGSAGSNANGGATCATTVCTKEYKPHCGSDGKTYANKCEFTNAQCKASTTANKLTLKAEAACDDAASVSGDAAASKISAGSSVDCTTTCTKEFAPVCGSNAVTYDNACLFKNAQCTNATLTQTASTACPTAAEPKNAATDARFSTSARIATACAVVLSAVASLAL